MKLGLVLPRVPSYSETFFSNKIKGLSEHGVQLILFVGHNKTKSTYNNIPVLRSPNFSGNLVQNALSILRQLIKLVFTNPKRSIKFYKLNRENKLTTLQNIRQVLSNQHLLDTDLDWLHFGFGTMALGRENIARVIGAQLAVSFRGYDIMQYPLKNENCYNFLWEKVDKIHVISESIRNRVYELGFKDQCPIVKICPAIDISLFRQSHTKTFGEPIKILTVARLHAVKGIDFILKALAVLKKKGIKFEYCIVGTGLEEVKLKELTLSLGISNQVSFLGQLKPFEVKKQLEQNHVYIQYSLSEGFGNSVLEAQALGLLCVVSDAGGLNENVIDNKTGWVVPRSNEKILSEKLFEILSLDFEEKSRISKNAITRVKNYFNLQNQKQEFLKFYEEN